MNKLMRSQAHPFVIEGQQYQLDQATFELFVVIRDNRSDSRSTLISHIRAHTACFGKQFVIWFLVAFVPPTRLSHMPRSHFNKAADELVVRYKSSHDLRDLALAITTLPDLQFVWTCLWSRKTQGLNKVDASTKGLESNWHSLESLKLLVSALRRKFNNFVATQRSRGAKRSLSCSDSSSPPSTEPETPPPPFKRLKVGSELSSLNEQKVDVVDNPLFSVLVKDVWLTADNSHELLQKGPLYLDSVDDF